MSDYINRIRHAEKRLKKQMKRRGLEPDGAPAPLPKDMEIIRACDYKNFARQAKRKKAMLQVPGMAASLKEWFLRIGKPEQKPMPDYWAARRKRLKAEAAAGARPGPPNGRRARRRYEQLRPWSVGAARTLKILNEAGFGIAHETDFKPTWQQQKRTIAGPTVFHKQQLIR